MDGIKNTLRLTMILLLSAFTVHAGEKKDVVVMLGDSTTLCDLNKPGAKLTDYVQSYLTRRKLKTRIVNSGAGGETAKAGFNRMQKDVIAHNPAVVTISFGLNDTGMLTPAEYRRWMEKIVQSVQANTRAKILLITSTPFNNKRHAWKNRFRAKGGLDEYMDANICAAQRALAKEHKLPLCDLHRYFLAHFKKNPKLIDQLILPDGVHLTDKGNKLAARYIARSVARLLTKPAKKK